jgi:YHS domain-containing protein
MDGFCPVTLHKQQKWTRGDRRWGVIHRGHTYLFASAEAQKQFWENPDLFSPVLSGTDPVVALEERRSVAGQRKHGVFYGGRVYLFANEASLDRFSDSPEKYASGVRQAMQQAAGDIGRR